MTKVARAVSEKSEQLDFTKKYSKDTGKWGFDFCHKKVLPSS